ncbi:Thiosulfate sulfurtransferase GlpE [bioreactor metagenome]|uniref:Thiosulfate sulfurtransferase GlpE n=1 Tax=bioreactor metagenome TaxID=1076179 RepID=A0A645FNH9_9ZZZZ|nr:rhodanese-like domain-containing protein [Christensenella sp.]
MKKFVSILAMALSVITFSACAAPAAAAEPTPSAVPAAAEEARATPAQYQKITAKQAKARMDSGDEVVILDVRTQEEYDAGHIAGAILIPNETILDEQPSLLPDLGAEILIYCRSGNRSAQAANKLLAIGYTNVFDFGGIIDWPYEVVTD